MTGTLVLHYEILEKLGEGGMGVVYKARDKHLDRFVALKMLSSERVANAERKRRFVMEAKAASALNHPNIVTIYDIAQGDGIDFIAMEYVAGKTLDELIPPRGLPAQEAVKYSVQIADALGMAHAAGIVHRDLKPGNIMITQLGLVKLVDFGLAKLVEITGDYDATRTLDSDAGMVVGTASYMSPEQAESKNVDGRSDIFSFGLVLYEMLSGDRPFHGESRISTLAAMLHREPEPLPGAIPEELEKIVMRCLRKDPARRFQHMGDVKVALEDLGSEKKPAPLESLPSIAVLPFLNLSADKENEYFSDGLAEEIINALSNISGLRVTARTSSFAFRGKEEDLRKIGEALNAGTILEGSVRRAGNRIRVTAQLISVAGGHHLWSERYDRELTDVFAIQDEISQAIVGNLRVKLALPPDQRLVKRCTECLDAYQSYLEGRYHVIKLAKDSLAKAKECFERAIEQDPNYALAYAGLADYYFNVAIAGLGIPGEVLLKAEQAVRKALELDDTLAEAHSALGAFHVLAEFDWNAAGREFQRAIALSPSPIVRYSYTWRYLRPLGRLDEALSEVERALELDPFSSGARVTRAAILHLKRRYHLAVDQCQKAIEIDPKFPTAYWVMATAYLEQGLLDEAVAALEKTAELIGRTPLITGLLGRCYAQMGRADEARKLLQELQERSRHAYVQATSLAWIHIGLREPDQAFEQLEKAVAQRDPFVTALKIDPHYDSLRADPRYRTLLGKMNLQF